MKGIDLNNLLFDDNSIKGLHFKCLLTNKTYTVVNSSSNGTLTNTIDTVVRCDGERRDIKRSDLKKRFTNVELLKIFYEPEPKTPKRSRVKR